MSIIKNIENIIRNAIGQYARKIADKYENVELEELHKIWTEISDDINISSSTVSAKNKVLCDNGCSYVFSRGKNSGDKCGSKTIENTSFCSRHKKQEGKEAKVKKTIPVVSKKNTNPDVKITPKSTDRILKQHKILKKLWHQETGMIFKSAEEKIVIGKVVNNTIIPLTDEDVEICKTWMFGYELKTTENSIPISVKPKSALSNKDIDNLKSQDVEKVINTIKKSSNSDEDVDEDEDEDVDE